MPSPSPRAAVVEERNRLRAERAEKALDELTRAGLLIRSPSCRRPLLYTFRLNDRQREVLWSLEVGVRAEEIASQLGLSVAAVQRHCSELRAILGQGRIGIGILREIAWLWKTGELHIVRPIEHIPFKTGSVARSPRTSTRAV